MAIAYRCPRELLNSWWVPLAQAGLEVRLFSTGNDAREICARQFGEMWEDQLIAYNVGGVIVQDQVVVFVSIPNASKTSGQSQEIEVDVLVGLLPPKRLFRSKTERELLACVSAILEEAGFQKKEAAGQS